MGSLSPSSSPLAWKRCPEFGFSGLSTSLTLKRLHVCLLIISLIIFCFVLFSLDYPCRGLKTKYLNSTCKELSCTTEHRCACKEGQQNTL